MTVLKNNKNLLYGILLLLVFLVLILSQLEQKEPRKRPAKHVSFIVYGDDSERWENMRQGAYLVCDENNADLSLITMLSEDDANEQKEIIDREIEDGADVLIVAACNSKEIADYIKEKRMPAVFVETVDEEYLGGKDVVSPDDYKMGYELGESIVKNESEITTVAIISEHTDRDSVTLREKGLRDAIEGKVGKIINWTRSEKQVNSNTRTFIQRAIVSEATDVIVTFDNSTTDALLDALTNLNKQSRVYSVSTSNKAVYSLYNGDVRSLEFSNEFSMGYIAAMYAVDRSGARKKYSDYAIDHRIVRKENMYDEDNQTLLFPFVN